MWDMPGYGRSSQAPEQPVDFGVQAGCDPGDSCLGFDVHQTTPRGGVRSKNLRRADKLIGLVRVGPPRGDGGGCRQLVLR